ncbi:MAG: SDR family oxidoreductase [Gaiellales bacterium]|nr:SDR family oxidoreductase [Gaiellales bacterium]
MSQRASLAGSEAIVTGGSSGIGKAIAVRLVTAGANVTIAARREAVLAEAAQEIERRAGQICGPLLRGPAVRTAVVDVASKAAVEELAGRFAEEHGSLRYLINCAGITYPGYFADIPYQVFEEIMAVDYFGVLHMCRSFVPLMKSQGGHILNVSSVGGLYGGFGYTAYSAAKFAVIGFSQALRSEVKRFGITVSVLCPPDTDTPQLAFEEPLKPRETKAIASTAGRMSAEIVARAAVRSLSADRFIVLPGLSGKASYLAFRLAPGILERYLDRKIRAAARA